MSAEYLDPDREGYLGGFLEMASRRLYPFWGSLTEALRTGERQNETRQGNDLFDALYADPARLRIFLEAMTGLSLATARALAQKFPWREYRTFADIGTAQGCVPVQLAMTHPHLRGVGYDLPAVRPIFEENIARNNLQDRVRFYTGDFFTEPLASADVLVMGHILHDWGLEDKMRLLRKAYDALPKGGALVVYESLIDDQRRHNTQGLLMSLNMLIETAAGFDYTGADCREWMRQTGFSRSYVERLAGAESMVVGIK
jgi:SAM-dependent methyltransferase